ncbi:MAG: gas vesicle protein GvpK, partial [Planctomycetota bacterium]
RTLSAQSEAIREMAERFGLSVDDLNLDLGPLGKVL